MKDWNGDTNGTYVIEDGEIVQTLPPVESAEWLKLGVEPDEESVTEYMDRLVQMDSAPKAPEVLK